MRKGLSYAKQAFGRPVRVLALCITAAAFAGPPATGQSPPFSRGVNLTNWFQSGSIGQVQFSKYSKQDFANIKSLGCDVVRLPINMHYMTGGAPDYTLEPLFLDFMDQVVSWTEELDLHLILDNHTFDVTQSTDPGVGDILEKVWTQVADHYKDAYGKLYYEVLNEPHGIDDEVWNDIQGGVIDAIRTVDTRHTIIVGGAGWNSYNNLAAMPAYSDTNLIYTFHFYDPFLFTHQGASWVDPSMVPLAGIPFPYDPDSMPPLPSSLEGTWVGSNYNDYANTGNEQNVRDLLDIAIAFRNDRNVPLYCGELGVYIPNSDPQDRAHWYKLVVDYLGEHGIAWTSWDYQGGFGIFEPGGNGQFEHDLNVPLLDSMGLTPPAQTQYEMKPDSAGFFLYRDYMESGFQESSYGQGSINFYSTDRPDDGRYCIRWNHPGQYDIIGFDIFPVKDLSTLVSQGYALDFMARGYLSGGSFQVRFIDSKDSLEDHPWRMETTVNETLMAMDGRWHHIRIPLSDFYESGSWDVDTWYNQEGLFDWTAADRFEFVEESGGMENAAFWFDNISISDADTATVHDNTVYSDTTILHDTIVAEGYEVLADSLASHDTITEPDSIAVTRLIINKDSIVLVDTIRITDTATFFDTIRVADTLRFVDTISTADTLWFYDTLRVQSVPLIGQTNNILVYPNPAGDYVRVRAAVPGRLRLELKDVSGRLVTERRFSGETELVTTGLPGGIYIISIADAGGHVRQFRILKQ